MRAYRWSTKLKLGLIVFAVLIAVASLAYTNRVVDRLREREQALIQLWAEAQAQVSQRQVRNPYRAELAALKRLLAAEGTPDLSGLSAARIDSLRGALAWAQNMPPTGQLSFITNEILIPNPFNIPAVITGAEGHPLYWRNVPVPPADTLAVLPPNDSARVIARLHELQAEMGASYAPIPIVLETFEGDTLRQYLHYGESHLIEELQLFPYVQILFVGLFILVGYLGFSYVRRSEQSSLWVGMAKEAAHQLGTPLSSLMGWTQLVREGQLSSERRQEAFDEIESDIRRLQGVAARFSDIGSQPKLEVQPLAPLIERSADYLQRRLPSEGGRIELRTAVPPHLEAPVNAELFAWVVENLLKNAADAIEAEEGRISVAAHREDDGVAIEIEDTGSGIERRQRKNVFRPGYSTKERGWGLGLSLARRVIEDYHGGNLSIARSEPGEGTTFRIELPG